MLHPMGEDKYWTKSCVSLANKGITINLAKLSFTDSGKDYPEIFFRIACI